MDNIQKTINSKVKAGLENQKLLCGDCYGLNKAVLLEKCGKTCKHSDRVESSPACSSFAPSLEGFDSFSQTSLFGELANLMAACDSEKTLRQMGSIFFMESVTRQFGYSFNLKVYVRYRGASGSNYLSNFMTARVMYANPQHIRLMSEDGRLNLTYDICSRKNIMTLDEFEPLRSKMIRGNRLVDPDVETLLARRFRAEELHSLDMPKESLGGTVTTIDSVCKTNGVKKSKSKFTSLVDLAADAAAGFDVSKRAASYRGERRSSSGSSTIFDVSGAE